MKSVFSNVFNCRSKDQFYFFDLGRFGQTTPPLVDFLKDILRRYPEGGQILKVIKSIVLI